MMWAAVLLSILWPAVAHAQQATGAGLPMPGSWWEAVLGIVTLILTGGYGGSALTRAIRASGAGGQAAPDSEVVARIKAIEDAGRAAKEQGETAERERRLSELEAKVTGQAAEIATLRAMVSQASERTTAGLDSVAASLKRLEGGG